MPSSRHAEQSKQTKRRLMNATRDLVVSEGWSAASSRAIAERAGVNQALINFHFDGKADLFRATLDRCVDEIEREFGPWMAAASLEAYIDTCVASIPKVRRNKNFQFLMAAMLEGAHDAKIKAAVIDQLHALRDGLRIFLTGAGLPESRVGPYAAIMAAAMDGLMIHFMLDPTTDAEGALRAFEEMVTLRVRENR
jgi:AcrR family transcriptional regulator